MPGDHSRRVSWIWLGILAAALVLALGFGAIEWSIYSGIRDAKAMAVRAYPGDGERALIAFVELEEQELSARNRAVWALGQLRDRRALPVLERYYTGQPCDHARRLCQHELKKAIDLIRSSAKP